MKISVDILCYNGCGYQEDALVPTTSLRDGFAICPRCGEWARRFFGYAGKIGVIFTPRTYGGETFASNEEERQFYKDNPGTVALVKGSTDERKVADRIRERAEASAKAQGFNDLDHRTSYYKTEMAKGWNPSQARIDKRARNKGR